MRFPSLRKIGLDHLWVLIVVAGVFIFVNTQPIRPHDFWWHLAVGREIATTHAIPSVDIYSFTMAGTPYPSYQMFWLADLSLYGIYHFGGPALVIFMQSLLITTTYSILLWLSWKTSKSWRIAAVSVLIAIALGINNWNVRPQAVSYLMGVLFMVAIYSYRRNGRRIWLLLLPLGMLVWVNSHGSFLIGLVIIAIWVGDELWQVFADRFRKNVKKSSENLWVSLVSLGVTSLVCLANPRGIGIVTYIRTLTSDTTVQNLVPEWAPPAFNDAYGILFFGALMLSAVVLAISPKRPSFTQLATFVVFGVLGLRTTRGVVWFGILMAPILADHIAEIVRAYGRGESRKIKRSGIPVLNWILMAIILAAALISLPWFKNYFPFPSTKAGLISSETPVEATEFLLAEELPGEIFNEIGFGSYMIWAAYPQYQVFADPRIELYPLDLWWDYTALGNALTGWENYLNQYRINTLILNPTTQAALVMALEESPGWVKNYEDRAAVIFIRSVQ